MTTSQYQTLGNIWTGSLNSIIFISVQFIGSKLMYFTAITHLYKSLTLVLIIKTSSHHTF